MFQTTRLKFVFLFQKKPCSKLFEFGRRAFLCVHDETRWDSAGTTLLQIFFQRMTSLSKDATKYYQEAKKVLSEEPLIQSELTQFILNSFLMCFSFIIEFERTNLILCYPGFK
jgi:hypothetical protein